MSGSNMYFTIETIRGYDGTVNAFLKDYKGDVVCIGDGSSEYKALKMVCEIFEDICDIEEEKN